MFDWLFGKELVNVLNETREVRVSGIRFTIKKVVLANYLEGTKVLLATNDTHKTKGEKENAASNINHKRVEDHYRDVLIAGVVRPKLCYTEDQEKMGEGLWVDKLFNDWDMCSSLYGEIVQLTYGKKKFNRATLAAKGLSS